MKIEAEATLLVKTCWRPGKILNLVQSARQAYPGLAIVVCDDAAPAGQAPKAELEACGGVTVRQFPEDHGIGACYNAAIRETIQTPLTILCDDDDRFQGTDIEAWAPWIAAGGRWRCDLVGGRVNNPDGGLASTYVGRFEFKTRQDGTHLFLLHYRPHPTEPVDCDYMPNFFVARTDALRRTPWDEELRVCRHADWFLMAKRNGLRHIYHPGVAIVHAHNEPPPDPPEYRALRHGRYQDYVLRFEAKWQLARQGLHE